VPWSNKDHPFRKMNGCFCPEGDASVPFVFALRDEQDGDSKDQAMLVYVVSGNCTSRAAGAPP
jgi:hypothetical protein